MIFKQTRGKNAPPPPHNPPPPPPPLPALQGSGSASIIWKNPLGRRELSSKHKKKMFLDKKLMFGFVSIQQRVKYSHFFWRRSTSLFFCEITLRYINRGRGIHPDQINMALFVMVPCKNGQWVKSTVAYTGQVTFYKVQETHGHV